MLKLCDITGPFFYQIQLMLLVLQGINPRPYIYDLRKALHFFSETVIIHIGSLNGPPVQQQVAICNKEQSIFALVIYCSLSKAVLLIDKCAIYKKQLLFKMFSSKIIIHPYVCEIAFSHLFVVSKHVFSLKAPYSVS